jgi:hypothetical protein
VNTQILRGKDGRRWLLIEGQGACVELKSGPEPKPVKITKPRKPRRKRWDGF